jgi:2-desacetyl-2-hydroxyethyl bacteriochlorophyllide A dehydrogenase
MRASAILHTAVNTVTLDAVEIPDPGPGDVLIETWFSCISPGTELRCLAGRQPDTTWPYIPGYALTGVVVACGADVDLPVGTLVFCSGTRTASRTPMWGGHVSHALQRAAAVFPLPPEVDPLTATLAKLAGIAYHGLRLSRPLPHEQVAVVGLGPIGQLSARLHALIGAHVVAADPVASRTLLATQAGITAQVSTSDLLTTLGDLLPGGADILVDATGVPAVFADVCRLVRDLPWDDTPTAGARYLVQGSYADVVPVPYLPAFEKELNILIPRDLQPRDIRAVLDLMARNKLVARDLISAVRPPSAAAATYATLRERPAELLTAAFDWRAH